MQTKEPSSKTRRIKESKRVMENLKRLQARRAEMPSNTIPESCKNGRTVYRDGPKVYRNDPCPCGSGSKYKKCCLNKEREEQDVSLRDTESEQ